MPAGTRSNPLALAVLTALAEQPSHPYEIATRLRARRKHESLRLNYGSLYAVVASLERRRLIAPTGTERVGNLPPRTIYAVTEAGRQEMHDWLSDLLSTPVNDYPSLEAALSLLPALPPDEAAQLLDMRVQSLDLELSAAHALREHMERTQFPRIFWVEAEFRCRLREAERQYAKDLAADIRHSRLPGIDWWRSVYADSGPDVVPPFPETRRPDPE